MDNDPALLKIHDSFPCFHPTFDTLADKQINDCRFVRTIEGDTWHVIAFVRGVHDKSIRQQTDIKFKYNKLGEIVEIWERCLDEVPRFHVLALGMDTDFLVVLNVLDVIITRTLDLINNLHVCHLYKQPTLFLQACLCWDRKQVFLHRHVYEEISVVDRHLLRQLDYMYELCRRFLFNKSVKKKVHTNQKVIACQAKRCHLTTYDYRFLINDQANQLIMRFHKFYCQPTTLKQSMETKLERFITHVWPSLATDSRLGETMRLIALYQDRKRPKQHDYISHTV
jgi:hypothetical protein